MRLLRDSTSIEDSWRLPHRIDSRRFVYCGLATLSFQVGNRCLVSTYLCFLNSYTLYQWTDVSKRTIIFLSLWIMRCWVLATISQSCVSRNRTLIQLLILQTVWSIQIDSTLRRFFDIKLIDLDLDVAGSSSILLSWALLDIILCFLFKKMIVGSIEKFMMFNIRRRWVHSSRERSTFGPYVHDLNFDSIIFD